MRAGGVFGGFVVNANCITRGHRDKLDKLLCVCFAFGEWEGGQLVIDELGLVFDLKPGHVIIFDSRGLTHFNLHYRGHRSSVVLHSDDYLKHAKGLEERMADLKVGYGLGKTKDRTETTSGA